ncbi:phage capsid protein [Providencia rettgeri]
MTQLAPFPVDPTLTAITIAYRNARLIADEVLPRVPVSSQAFTFTQYTLTEGFTVPKTLVGRTGQPTRVEFTGKEIPDTTQDHALDAPVPFADVENAKSKPNFDPLGRATEQTTNLILLDREVRTAKLVFNKNSYGNDNRATLTAANAWSNPDSNPMIAIMDALDTMIMRPTLAVFGRRVATHLRRHPKIVKAFNGTMGEDGMVPLAFLAELLELESILVGEGFVNNAKNGQKPNIERAWGDHAAFLYRDKLADSQHGTTFGFTAQWGGRTTASWVDQNIGMRGGQLIRVGESVKEVVAAKELGYFFENAVVTP